MGRPLRGAGEPRLDLVEQLGDEGDDRDDGRGDPEKAKTRHQRLNGPTPRCVRTDDAQVRMVVVAVVPPRLARIVYSPFAAVPPKLP
jgi:hypothetical protein